MAKIFDKIGTIPSGRLENIPEKSQIYHEFCFHLHDRMVDQLMRIHNLELGHVKLDNLSTDQIEQLNNGVHILDLLHQSNQYALEKRAVINHVTNALYADMCHFIHDGLKALEKRKFTVAFSLLRKPLKESLYIAAQICANEDEFFNTLKDNPSSLLGRTSKTTEARIKILEDAVRECQIEGDVVPKLLDDTIFNRNNPHSLAVLFDKATHLITEHKPIRTEKYNLNFIFKDPNDDDVYSENVYTQLIWGLYLANVFLAKLVNRMGDQNKGYSNWLDLTTIGTYSCLFGNSSPPILRTLNKSLASFLTCVNCEERMKINKFNGPRLFISERLTCQNCNIDQNFPFLWLYTKLNDQKVSK